MTTPSPTPARPGRPRARRRGIGPAATMGLVLFGALVLAGVVGAGVAARDLRLDQQRPARTRRSWSRSSCPSSRSSTTGPARSSSPGSASSTARSSRSTRLPPVLVDATTAVEDGSFWDNAGFDTIGHRRRRHRLPARRAARRLDDHPAARPPAAADRERHGARRSSSATRKLREIIQSIRVTQAYPGVDGQAADHGRLPQPELLRQRVVRRRGGRARATSASRSSRT